MKKLSNTKDELKKSVAYKKKRVIVFDYIRNYYWKVVQSIKVKNRQIFWNFSGH